MTDFRHPQQKNVIDNILIDIDIISCFNGFAFGSSPVRKPQAGDAYLSQEKRAEMKSQQRFLLSAVTLGVLAMINQAHAADAPQPTETAPSQTKEVAAEVQQVVVTGQASRGVRKLDASYSITTANEEQLKVAAPSSTADLLKIVPGVFAEATGGVAGANIAVRGFPSGGDAPFVTIQLNGSPLFPPPTLSFLENSSLFRLDDTIERVEVLRGGPSTVFSNGQPGATVNFIQKKGITETPEGSLRLTVGTGQLRRVDVFYGGKIAEGWYGTVGGFHRTTHSVRDAQFPADDGGQVAASLTRVLDQGEMTFYVRSTKDKNAFYTGVPLISATTSTGQPSAFPGFDPLTGTLSSNELRNVMLEVGPGQVLQKDLADGRGLKSTLIGADFSKRIGGWNISNKASYLSGDAPTLAIFAGGENPQSMSDYIARKITAANADARVLAAAGRPATKGTATYTNGGAAVAPGQQVFSAGIWSVEKQIEAFTDELRLSRELFPGHTLTAGAYLADFSSKDQWYLGNGTLMTAQNNARPINLTLDNGVVISGNGHDGASFYTLNERFNGHNTALFLVDEWKVSDKVSLDAGVRYEKQRIDGTISNPVSRDIDNNPLTVYNNNASVLSGSNTAVHREDAEWSYTIGGGYKLSANASVFARLNSGVAFPQFDTLRDFGDRAPMVKIKQFEIGYKTVGSFYSAYLTAFRTDFTGLPFNQILSNGTQVNALGGSEGNGVEFEVAVRPLKELSIALTGNWQDSKYKDFTGSTDAGQNGNRVQRQPKFQARLTPTYRIPMDWGDIKLHATYTTIGDRWSDTQNKQLLPGYKTLDAGVLVSIGDNVEVRVNGNNLTNEFGLTEGNARIIGGGGGVVFGRPIFGRNIEASLLYRF
jgi:iron complex outermembrane recepter protein